MIEEQQTAAPEAVEEQPGAQALDALEAEAQALETGGGPSEAEARQSRAIAVSEQAAGAAELIEFGWELLGPFLPERYAACYTEQKRAKVAQTFAALAVKRGWEFGDVMGKFGAELAFAGAIMGPVLPVVMAEVKARKEAQAAAMGKAS